MKRSSRSLLNGLLVIFAVGVIAASEGCSSRETEGALGRQRIAIKTASVPGEVAGWFATAYGADTADIISYSESDLKETGQKIHRLKAIRRSDNEVVGVCFDAKGAALSDCGYTLRVANEGRVRDLKGTVDDELQARLDASTAEELNDVGVWLKVVQNYPRKEDVLADPAYAARVTAEQDAVVAAARTKFLKQLPAELATRFSLPPRAPIAFASLKRRDIEAVSRLESVALTVLHKPNKDAATTYKASANAVGTGYEGTGVPVCVLDANQPPTPNSLTLAGRYCATGQSLWHARWVAGAVRIGSSPNGIAAGSSLYMASWNGCDANSAGALAYCGSVASIWSFSQTCSATEDRLFDYYAKTPPYAFVAVSAGNRPCGAAPAQPSSNSYNTLIVGGADERGTAGRSDDTIFCGNRDLNPSGRELPHLVAPAQDVTTDDTADGTSVSAPMVAGAAAQLHQRNSALVGWPEITRSILMVSATESVSGGPLDLSDSVDDADGAGELSVADALYVGDASRKVNGGNAAASAGHDYGTITSSATPAGSWYSESYTARSSSWNRLRVVLSWDASATCTNPGTPNLVSCGAQTLDGDLDLWVYRKSDGALMAASTTSANSYEFVEFDVTPNVEYEIRIKAYSWNAPSTYFGLAWYAANHSTS